MTAKESNIATVVLAAGKGARMRSSEHKVMHKIAGVSMIRYVIATLDAFNPKSINLVLAPGMETVEAEAKSASKKVTTCIQKKPNGTGDAVKSAREQLKNFDGTVLILFGDTPFISEYTLQFMVEALNRDDNYAVAVLGFVAEDPGEYGRLILDENGELEKIVEFKDATEDEQMVDLCNSGVMAVRGPLLLKLLDALDHDNAKGEYYLTDIVGIAKEKGHTCIAIEAEEQEVMGINTREQLAQAEAIVQSYLRWNAIENGVTMIDPNTVYLDHDTTFGQDVTVHPFVVFGPGVKVGDEVEIKSFSHIEGAMIAKGATVGPYARLRPGAEIGESASIGNFVEIKKSKIGKGSKVNHLSYIGDATLGKDVNIGAGTITCNYDGKKKSETHIADGAFIGSNTALVAPVKIGKNAVVGAGTTLLKDVAGGTVTVNKKTQESRKEK